MKVVEKQLKELRMYENNPRNNDQAVDEVAKSIQEFGFKVPMVIDANNVIVCGHTRYKACLKLGIESVPCVVADDLSPEQIKAFRLVENKTSEVATWDFDKLNDELESISRDLDLFDVSKNNEWFENRETWDDSHQEGNDEYNEFVDKFEIPKTTDDCYTPENIYDAVADYVAEQFNKDRKNFVRPFYPGGDYKSEDYKPTDVVVDNPPFSILAEIVDYYVANGIKFFLFCPTNTNFNYLSRNGVCCYPVGVSVIYENKAIVMTSFLSNIREDGVVIDNDPKLWNAIDKENRVNLAKLHANLPTYEYPSEILTSTKSAWISKRGCRLQIQKKDCMIIRQLDAQKDIDKAIYGCGVLLSEKATVEREAVEREAVEREAVERDLEENVHIFELSDRERELQRSLG